MQGLQKTQMFRFAMYCLCLLTRELIIFGDSGWKLGDTWWARCSGVDQKMRCSGTAARGRKKPKVIWMHVEGGVNHFGFRLNLDARYASHSVVKTRNESTVGGAVVAWEGSSGTGWSNVNGKELLCLIKRLRNHLEILS